jgi:hypothetical protein
LRLCTDIAREQWVKMSEGLAGPSVTLEWILLDDT